MKKKLGITLLVLVLLGLAGGWFGGQYLNQYYVRLGTEFFRRDAEQVNLDGHPLKNRENLLKFDNLKKLDLIGTETGVEDYEWIRENLPDCEVRWELPFQGQYLSLDTESLQVDHLSREDAALLHYLPKLHMIDAWDCHEYDLLREVQKELPNCKVMYYVQVGDSYWSQDWEELTLKNADLQELEEKLPLLPGVKRIHLTGQLPSYDGLQKIMEDHPAIEVTWDVSFRGQGYRMEEPFLNMDGVELRFAEAKDLFSYLPQLEEVDLRGCSLTVDECKALCRSFPDILFRFELPVYDVVYSTDVEEIDISGNALSDPREAEELLTYFPKLKKLVMCDCGIDNVVMEDLNRRHEDVQFVWSVKLGQKMFRTDITYFMPVKYGFSVGDYALENLIYCHNIVCIDLGHQQVYKIDWAREMPDLRFVLLGDTPVEDISPLENHTKLAYLELFLTRVKDTEPLVSCTALEDLNFSYTQADAEPISRMTWLKRVWWSGWWQAQSLLPKALPDAELEFHSSSSTGKGWREGKLYYEQRDLMGMKYMTG